jgi:hypothetical protein
VEDEITTGRTVLHLSIKLCRHLEVDKVRFFAFADTRSERCKKRFNEILERTDIRYSFHVLARYKQNGEKEVNLLEKEIDESVYCNGENGLMHEFKTQWHMPHLRPALGNRADVSFEFTNKIQGSLLVVGEAVDLGLRIVQNNAKLAFHHVTLSPWKVDNINIFSRLDILNNYYLYNYRDLSSPLYILNDPVDEHIGNETYRILSQKGYDVTPYHLYNVA